MHYYERQQYCNRCRCQTVHWRETSYTPEQYRAGLIGRLRQVVDWFNCSWWCRRCTREFRNPGEEPTSLALASRGRGKAKAPEVRNPVLELKTQVAPVAPRLAGGLLSKA
jgi:hypothetical protein